MMIYLALIALIVVGGLIYTYKIGREISMRKSEYDTEINGSIQRHPVLLNPVFLAYIIGFGAVIIYVVYLAITKYK